MNNVPFPLIEVDGVQDMGFQDGIAELGLVHGRTHLVFPLLNGKQRTR